MQMAENANNGKCGRESTKCEEDLLMEAIRAKEALRISEEKYRTLFESIDEGFCVIEMLYDDDHVAVNYRFIEVNNSFERYTGLQNVIGKTGKEVSPGTEAYWIKIYDKLLSTGESCRFENYHEATDRWYDSYAALLGGAESSLVVIVFNDVTDRKRYDQRLKFLLKLTDVLRPLSDPLMIEEATTRLTQQFFVADRCYYCYVNASMVAILSDSSIDGLPEVSGEYNLDDMPILRSVIGNGKPFVVEDVHKSDLDENLRTLCIKLQVVSFIIVPLIKQDLPVGILCVVQCRPRRWSQSDSELAAEVAERMWTAMEKAKAEKALLTNLAYLRRTEARLGITMDAATDYAIITTDLNGIIEKWSRGAEMIFDYSADEVIG